MDAEDSKLAVSKMSLQLRDALAAAFTSDADDVQELTITHKGLTSLGCLATEAFPRLVSLNLAFNQLTTLSGLSTLTNLRALNVSHNRLITAASLAPLTSLSFLNLSHNALRSLDGVTECASLQELFIQNNRVAAVTGFRTLSQLTGLRKLCITGNPAIAELGSPPAARAALLAVCPSLGMLDGVAITESDVAAAAVEGQRAWQQEPPTDREQTQTNGQDTVAAPQHPASAQAPKRPVRKGPGAVRHPLSGIDRPCEVRDSGEEGKSWAGVPEKLLSSDREAEAQLVTACAEIKPRRRGGSKAIPSLQCLPETSAFQAVLAALPSIQPTRMPPTYTPGVGALQKNQRRLALPPLDAGVVTMELKYPAGGRGRAVRCTQDGSTSIAWPSGDLAVTLDVDYGSPTPGATRLLALFRGSGTPAASWDSMSGGFVQFPSGALCLTHDAASCKGMMLSSQGAVMHKWEGSKVQGNDQITIRLDAHFAVRFAASQNQLLVEFDCDGVNHAVSCGG